MLVAMIKTCLRPCVDICHDVNKWRTQRCLCVCRFHRTRGRGFDVVWTELLIRFVRPSVCLSVFLSDSECVQWSAAWSNVAGSIL